MPAFTIDWYVVDEERGWIVCQIENVMDDPGDGSLNQGANITTPRSPTPPTWTST
jgi:hypothetical protein